MYKVSPSGISYLRECPRCLWLYYREGVSRPKGIFPSLPSGMDEVLKKYFDAYRLRGELPPELKGKITDALYPDFTKLKKMRQIFHGLVAEFPELDMRLKGAIDELLVNKQGQHVVFDFKTRGYPVKADTHEHYQDQVNLYALLLEKNNLPPADYGYLFFIHPTEYAVCKATFHPQIVKMNSDWRQGMNILQEVKSLLEGPEPQAHSSCAYCLYRSAS
ncbi:MAG: hypothetical protein A3A65_01185 [Candidatus Chisholmbacteria bacterium RIFCSPLOWO2_01_FULL_49_14]|uniref:PD-(D/E)XK endonuclease-like domain-containing protein n=1 Tax=Candidatus Chisholmbacteria bacterium RIFCSPLOWO2_01_FULL_49_14 TaxID=1797593 RepID=A0A1G1VZD8_9BACT|nr:MAG: hypothetical protein A3A65_01185 [Candidatus Chisholmbacteria bacterium RIFCSPLOWO2_01_FULL_49_14]